MKEVISLIIFIGMFIIMFIIMIPTIISLFAITCSITIILLYLDILNMLISYSKYCYKKREKVCDFLFGAYLEDDF